MRMDSRGRIAGVVILITLVGILGGWPNPTAYGAATGLSKSMYAYGPAPEQPPAARLILYDRSGARAGRQTGVLRHALWASSDGSWLSSTIPPLGWPDPTRVPELASAELDLGTLPPEEVTIRFYTSITGGGFPQEAPAHELHCRLNAEADETCSFGMNESQGRVVVVFSWPLRVEEWFVTVQASWPRAVTDAPFFAEGPGGVATWGFRLST